MILSISDVLDASALLQVRELAAAGIFEDGRATAGCSARLVKNNRQLASGQEAHGKLTDVLITALSGCRMLQIAALPKTFRPPMVSRCDAGMGYGPHVDDALMGQPPTRADLAYTLFISDPHAYDGGELVLEDTQGEHSFKLPAGCLVLYPATYIHRVETVRAGSRLVAVGWVQSVCRAAGHREILFDLHCTMATEFEQRGKTRQFDLLAKTRSNLLRLFADV